MTLNVPLLRSSFDLVVERQPQLTRRFYEILFKRYPEAKPLFHRNKPELQEKMLTDALGGGDGLHRGSPWLTATLKQMGKKHVEYGVTNEMYGWVGASLLAALAEAAGDYWSPELETAWTDAYGAIAGLMQAGAAEA